MARTYSIGCDTTSDVPLADPTVSRQHAGLSVLDDGQIELVDLHSTNGTHVLRGDTRLRVEQPTLLHASDEVAFGDLVVPLSALIDIVNHIEEQRTPRPEPSSDESAGDETAQASRSGLLEFIPILDAYQRMKTRGLLFPVLGLVLLGAALWTRFDDPFDFLNLISIALAMLAFLVVYRLCGKHKPLWMIAAVMAGEWLVLEFLFSPVLAPIFRPAFMDPWAESPALLYRFLNHFTGAGLLEELCKMIPVFVVIGLTLRSARPDTSRWGVTEPLDAVVYACAAATVFVLVETLTDYVPFVMIQAVEATEGDLNYAFLQGLQLGIARTVDSLPGHLAYSGYFAYFVGLGLLRPLERTRLWLGGWIVSSALHGMGNAVQVMFLRTTISLTALAFLFAVIVNARKLSPTRSQNFATMALTGRRLKSRSRRLVDGGSA